MLLLIIAAMAILVGLLRFVSLGDINWMIKLPESLAWALTTAIFLFVLEKLAAFMLHPSETSRPSRKSGERQGMTSEELNAIESEIPEVHRPEFAGVHGRPPEEMAEVVRKMANSDQV